MEPNYPDFDNLNIYESIYIAEVTSVYLEQKEESLLYLHKHKRKGRREWGSNFYSIRAVVTENVTGKEENILELQFRHCGTLLPELTSTGIFFVSSDGVAIPVYNNNGNNFISALRAIEKIEH